MANHFSILLSLFFLLSPFHIHARDSQFFNKMPSKNNNNVVVVNKEQTTLAPQEQQPSFMPESENGGYGLYGRESTTQKNNLPYQEEENLPNKRYLPKNYNPVAYVTAPDDNASRGKQQMTKMPSDAFAQSKDNYYTNGGNNYFNNQKESFPSSSSAAVGGGDRYNSYNGGAQKQGMSDTRFLDNGRYYYGVNNGEQFPRNPLDNSRNEFGNSRNFNENNNNNFMGNSYQNEEEFEDEDDDLP